LYGAAISRGRFRYIYWASAGVALALVLAASARGGLLALVVSTLIMSALYFRRFIAPHLRVAMIFAVLLVFVLAVGAEPIIEYTITILELDSKTRGFGTGGTGRVERWLASLEYIENGQLQLFIGSGLRTVGEETLGFTSTENSYLNIAIESGLFATLACIVLFFGAIFRLHYRSRHDNHIVWVFLTWLLIYICIQSFFNRYLLAIGNSLSFYVLLTTAIAWLPYKGTVSSKLKVKMPWE